MSLKFLDSVNWNWPLAGRGREGREAGMERRVLPGKEEKDQMRSLPGCNFRKIEPQVLWCLGWVLLEAWNGDTWDLPVLCCQQVSMKSIGKVSATLAADVHKRIHAFSSYIPAFFHYIFASFCMKWDGYPGSTNNILTFCPTLTNSRRPSLCQGTSRVGESKRVPMEEMNLWFCNSRLYCNAYAWKDSVVIVQTILTVPFLIVWVLVFGVLVF